MRKEHMCIQLCVKAKIDYAKSELNELRINGTQFNYPLFEKGLLMDGVEWKEKTVEKTVQLFIFALILLSLAVFSPFAYFFHTCKVTKTIFELKREIKSLEKGYCQVGSPLVKSLEDLWNTHGLADKKYVMKDKMELLNNWVNVLYGEEVANGIHVQGRFEKIINSRANLNLAYDKGEKGAAHFYFGCPFDDLIRCLSKEFPYTSNHVDEV